MGKSKEICSCKHVTKDEIREAVHEGATTFKDVKRATGAGSRCGKCRKKVEKIVEDELKEMEKEAEKMAAATLEEDASASRDDQAAPETAPAEEAPSFPEELSERAAPAPQQELKVGGIYRKLCGDGTLWIRPQEMFLSPVDRTRYPDATQKERFCLMDVTSVRSE